MIRGSIYVAKNVDKIRLENKGWGITGEPNAMGDQRGVPVSEETIQCLQEFKFLEESCTGQMCMIWKLWICQRFVRRKTKDVFITLVSVQLFQLICLC